MDFLSKVSEYKGKEVIVVMSDGRAMRGILDSISDDMLLLTHPMETDNSEIEWTEHEGKKHGFVPWRRVNFKEVVLRIDGILRVWPYDIIQVNQDDKDTKPDRTDTRRTKDTSSAISMFGEYTMISNM